MAEGGNTFSSELEGMSMNGHTTQPSTTMPKGSTTVLGNTTVPPSRDGNTLNDSTAHPLIRTATMKSRRPVPAGIETTRTQNHLVNGSDAYVMSSRVTPTSFARQQPPTSPSRPRSESVPQKTAIPPEQSGSISQPSLIRRSTADKPSVQQIGPINTVQDSDLWNHEQEARTRPHINVAARRQGPPTPFKPRSSSTSSGDSARSWTSSSPVSNSTDTSLAIMDESSQQQPLPPHGTRSTSVDTNAAISVSNIETLSRSIHRRTSAASWRSQVVIDEQADAMPSSSSRPRNESTRSQTIASGQLANKPKHLVDQLSMRRRVSHPRVNNDPDADTTTSPSSLWPFTSEPATTPHHGIWQRSLQKTLSCLKRVAKKWDSIIGTLTLILVLIGVIFSGIGMKRSEVANQKSDESFRLTQWRNCIDLGVSRTTLRTLMLQPGDWRVRQDKIGNTATCQELLAIGFDALNNRPSKSDNGRQVLAGTSHIPAPTKKTGEFSKRYLLPPRGDDGSPAVCGVILKILGFLAKS